MDSILFGLEKNKKNLWIFLRFGLDQRKKMYWIITRVWNEIDPMNQNIQKWKTKHMILKKKNDWIQI